MSKKIKKILIAEDSSEWQKFHSSLLKQYVRADILLDIAPSARDALELVQKNISEPYDVVLSDLQMESEFLPEFAGEWFIKNLKKLKEYNNVPIVIVSAAYNISFIAAKLGVGYLSKRTLVSNPDSYYFMLDEKIL